MVVLVVDVATVLKDCDVGAVMVEDAFATTGRVAAVLFSPTADDVTKGGGAVAVVTTTGVFDELVAAWVALVIPMPLAAWVVGFAVEATIVAAIAGHEARGMHMSVESKTKPSMHSQPARHSIVQISGEGAAQVFGHALAQGL